MNKIVSLSGLILAVSAQASIVEIPGAVMECTPEAGQKLNYSVKLAVQSDADLILTVVKTDASTTLKEYSQRMATASLTQRSEIMPDGQILETPLLRLDMGNDDALVLELTSNTDGPWLGVLKMGKDEGMRLICSQVLPAAK